LYHDKKADEFNQPALVDSVIRGEEPEFLNVSRQIVSGCQN
jgi:hypothetical protein